MKLIGEARRGLSGFPLWTTAAEKVASNPFLEYHLPVTSKSAARSIL
jgi:hypothetical protein